MIAVNIILMTVVAIGILSLLAWAIVSDRRSKRAAGGVSAAAPLHHNLMMPHELRAHRAAAPRIHAARGPHQLKSHSAVA